MALLIYKQWHRQPNRKDTPGSNAAHVRYIGMREHALKNAETGNGLFGQYDGKNTNDINLENAMKYVGNLSRKNTTVYRSCISFTPERAKMLDLNDNKKQWENFVKYHIHSLAIQNNIKLSDFEYLAAVHDKEGQPHVHIIFWDKNQKIGVNVVNPQVCSSIREEIEERTFAPIAQELLSEEEIENGELPNSFTYDNGNKIRTELIKRAFANEQKAYYELKNLSFDDVADLTTTEVLELLGAKGSSEMAKQLKLLQQEIYEKGCFLLGRLPVEIQKKVLEVTRQLINTTQEIKAHSDMYMEAEQLILEMYNSTVEQPGIYSIARGMGKAKDKLEKAAANRILKAFKNAFIEQRLIDKSLRMSEEKKEQLKHNANQSQMNMALLSILKIAKNLSANGQADIQASSVRVFGRGDLSKAAIMDLIYKNKDRENQR